MTTYLLLVATTAACCLLSGYVLDLRAALRDLRRDYEEESAWAEEYARQAVVAQTELAQVRREYAALNWVYEGTNMMQLGAAWRAGTKKGKVGA